MNGPPRRCRAGSAAFLYDVAPAYTAFYDQRSRFSSPTARPGASRLALCDVTARVLAAGLDLLGIEAPEAPLEILEEVQADRVQTVLRLLVERRQLAGEQQDAHGDQDRPGDGGDQQVVVAQPAEGDRARLKATAVSRNGTARPSE